jgi:beta-galactosidase/beta-glucuronidase
MRLRQYPRPQLRRASWISLDGPWDFAFDYDMKWRTPAEVPDWPLTIEVPYAPECVLSGIADPGFHRACWYRRTFEIHDLAAHRRQNGRVLLHFGAVDYQAAVWINNIKVATHEGGHTPFSVDITFQLNQEGPQVVAVWAEDDPHDLEKPRASKTGSFVRTASGIRVQLAFGRRYGLNAFRQPTCRPCDGYRTSNVGR